MMSHVLLILLNELCKSGHYIVFFATSLINSIIKEHECYIL